MFRPTADGCSGLGDVPREGTMTSERHAAFTAARSQIAELAAAKLFESEREVLFNACEDMLLAGCDDEASAAWRSAVVQLDRLAESGRWTVTMRAQLLDLIEACGPDLAVVAA
jgi:hypothetical protein